MQWIINGAFIFFFAIIILQAVAKVTSCFPKKKPTRVELTEQESKQISQEISNEFYTNNYDELQSLESNLVDAAVKTKGTSKLPLEEQMNLYQSVIDAWDELYNFCLDKGKFGEGATYFSENWEHCHNSKNLDFCYIDRFQEKLEKLEEKYYGID